MAGSRSFGLGALRKKTELIPLVSILTAAVTGACGFMGHALYTKPDVRVVKSRGPAHDDVGPQELRKLHRVNQKIPMPPPEILQLRKEIGSYKS